MNDETGMRDCQETERTSGFDAVAVTAGAQPEMMHTTSSLM